MNEYCNAVLSNYETDKSVTKTAEDREDVLNEFTEEYETIEN